MLLVTSNDLGGVVGEYDPSTGVYLGAFATLQPGYNVFDGIAVAPNGNVYLGESGSTHATIFVYSPADAALGAFAASLTGTTVNDMAFGPNGDIYVLQPFTNPPFDGYVSEFNSTTGLLVGETFPSNNVNAVAVAPNGNVMVGDRYGDEIFGTNGVLLDQVSFPGVPGGIFVTPGGFTYATFFVGSGGVNYPAQSGLASCASCETPSQSLSFFGIGGLDPNNGRLAGVILSPDGTQVIVASMSANTLLEFNATSGAYEGILANTGAVTSPDHLALIDTPQSAAPEPGTLALTAVALMLLAVRPARAWRKGALPD